MSRIASVTKMFCTQ